jgi:hypothetical protein
MTARSPRTTRAGAKIGGVNGSGGPTGEQDPLVTAALVEVLDRVPVLRRRMHGLGARGPLPGSPAALDDAATRFGENGWALASSSWLVASDHALAWQRLLRSGTQPMAAHATLLRAVLEGAAICRWLVEPGTTQIVRLQRAAAAQVADYDERRKFEQALGNPTAAGTFRPATDRLVNLRRQLTKAAIAETKFAGYLALVRDYGTPSRSDAEWLYRLLSGIAHAKQWAIIVGKIGPVIDAPGTRRLRQAHLSANDKLALATTQIAIATLEKALDELKVYAGQGGPVAQ